MSRAPDGTWQFGAGVQAVTPVSRVDDQTYLEHGLSFYKKLNRQDLTPGHTTAAGERYRTFDPSAAMLRCFQCHSTGTLSLTADNEIVPQETGVQCEACHGPGARHVRLKGAKAAIRNPVRLSASALNDQCGACHRKPAAAGSDTEFSNPWNARHQPLFLARSRCFLESKGKLSCLTCHAAHTKAATASCENCHPGVTHRTVRSETTGRCVACHMPSVEPRPGLAFANHWIGVYRGDPLRPAR